MSHDSSVIVFLDSSGDRAEAINHGLLAEGSRIADLLGGSVSAIIAEPCEHQSDALARAAMKILERHPFRLLLFAHTDQGSELAPLVAFHFDTVAVTDCRGIRFRDGILCYAKHIYGSQFEQEASFAAYPEIASLNLESLRLGENASSSYKHVKKIRLEVPEGTSKKRTIETIPPDFRTIDVRYAERILDIGTGCNQPALIELAKELSHLLKASIGTTRPVVDSGCLPKSRMIGQTGKTISPELFMALGVSGSPHHVAGIQKSGKILSVNSDAHAPIFEICDTGFVCDLNEVLPKLISRIKRYRDKGLT